jgi:hypothetical protein
VNEADVVLAPLIQSDGAVKNRPTIVLRKMPPFLAPIGLATMFKRA